MVMATVPELRTQAAELGLNVPRRVRKADLERLIAEHTEPLTVVAAVENDLRQLSEGAPELKRSALAATALALAGEMDDSGNSATSKSMCAKSLIDALERLQAQAPEREEKGDALDELAAARAARRAA